MTKDTEPATIWQIFEKGIGMKKLVMAIAFMGLTGNLFAITPDIQIIPMQPVYVNAVEKFRANEVFVSNRLTGPRINAMNEEFQALLDTLELNVEATTLTGIRLFEDKNDEEILSYVPRATVRLATLYELLLKQPNGESGFLLTDGAANIFYIQTIQPNSPKILSVGVDWEGGGWNFYAHPTQVPKPHVWRKGRQVVIPIVMGR